MAPPVRGTMRYFISVRIPVFGQILIALILTRKIRKKDHKNRTIMNEMAVISISVKIRERSKSSTILRRGNSSQRGAGVISSSSTGVIHDLFRVQC